MPFKVISRQSLFLLNIVGGTDAIDMHVCVITFQVILLIWGISWYAFHWSVCVPVPFI